jgi:hypothetical protein
MATAMRKKQRPAMVTKEILYPSCARCKNRTIVGVRSIRQRRLTTTALLGFAPARSTRASAAAAGNISACQHDDLGVSNYKLTSK